MFYLTLTPLDTVLYIDAINIDLLQNKVVSRLCKRDIGHMKGVYVTDEALSVIDNG